MKLPRLTVACLILALVLSACAQVADVGAGSPAVVMDAGAAAREQALARYAGGGTRPATVTPQIVGQSAARARALLEDQGLELRVVAFDRSQPVSVQWPPAGQPVPLDGAIEGWLGQPPEEVEVAAAPTETAPTQTAEPTPIPTPSTTPTPQSAQDVTTRYILPPHTAGLLRTNPRRLAALPLGTELTGNASWYGPGFHGLTTACGTVFDQNGPTLASRELRCGTVVRITGPTGLTVQATVTDWGPAEWTGRRFDLSAAVFNAIAPLGSGVIGVRVVTANVPA